MAHFFHFFPLLAALTLAASADEVPFYIGTFGSAERGEGIYTSTLDTATGKLGPIHLAADADAPNFLALAPNGRVLYAATGTHAGSVSAFTILPDATLSPLNSKPLGADGACHVSVDATGRNVLVTSYGGASIASVRIDPDGSLVGITSLVKFTGSGPNPKRQQKAFAHCACFDSSNHFVYSCNLGNDSIYIFTFNSANGDLTAADPSKVQVLPGSGPRHLAFHPSGRFVYVANELTATVTAFARDPANGSLAPLETVSTLSPGVPAAGATTAEIVCSPSGKWLYVSNRGPDTIAVFAIGPDGRLTLLQNAAAHAKSPRGFAIDPSGRWLITAGQSDGAISVLGIDPATGLLSYNGETASAVFPVCILFAPSPKP